MLHLVSRFFSFSTLRKRLARLWRCSFFTCTRSLIWLQLISCSTRTWKWTRRVCAQLWTRWISTFINIWGKKNTWLLGWCDWSNLFQPNAFIRINRAIGEVPSFQTYQHSCSHSYADGIRLDTCTVACLRTLYTCAHTSARLYTRYQLTVLAWRLEYHLTKFAWGGYQQENAKHQLMKQCQKENGVVKKLNMSKRDKYRQSRSTIPSRLTSLIWR